jgi:hypothetical protein
MTVPAFEVPRACAAAAALLATITSSPLSAQAPATGEADCPRITYIYLLGSSIFDTADPNLEGRFGWAYRAANALHVRTRESVIRRELLFEAGDCFDGYLLAESERLLRGHDFLARVDIFGVPQEDGSFHVIVDTRDDWSTQVDVRVRLANTLSLEGARIRETNLLGTGQTLGLFYYERDVARNYGASYFTPQLLGSRWDLHADVGRTRAGGMVRQEVAHPFIGEVGRWAATQSFLREDRHFDYVTASASSARTRLLVPQREQYFDVAVLHRFGLPGSATVVGAGVSGQDIAYPGEAMLAPDGSYTERVPADSGHIAAVAHQLVPISTLRLVGVVGQRRLNWVQRRGFDSLRGQQDIARGAEAMLAVGRSLPAGTGEDDLQTTFTHYTGAEIWGAFIASRGRFDARRSLEPDAAPRTWTDVFVDAELLVYLTPWWLPGQTFVFRTIGTGAWNTRVPYQLTLGGERAVRGYAPERLPGAHRVVISGEHRMDFGWPLPQMFDLGATIFADAGRVWRGNAPFGTNSGWRYSVGTGLRGAFPAGSRTTYRIDIAWPLATGFEPGGPRVLLSIGEILGLADRQRDPRFERSRPHDFAQRLIGPH